VKNIRKEENAVENPVNDYLRTLSLDRKQSHRNLEVYPLLSDVPLQLTCLVLDEALEEGGVRIEEVDEDGTVSQLKVVNRGDRPVLILDGEELVGARQNRIVNTTLLIAADSEIIIPVSCVEQGRWAYNTPSFQSEKRMMSSALRARKSVDIQCSLKRSGTFMSDQSAIWSGIARKARSMKAESPSMAMASIYEKEAPRLRDYVDRFRLLDGQLGAIFAINGEVVGGEFLGGVEPFAKTFRKIIESYALDAIDSIGTKAPQKVSKKEALTLLAAICSGRHQTYPSVGLGTDIRIESRRLTGFALVLDGRLLHLSVFVNHSSDDASETPTSRLARFSRRVRHRDA
jgi:hypothetical protein